MEDIGGLASVLLLSCYCIGLFRLAGFLSTQVPASLGLNGLDGGVQGTLTSPHWKMTHMVVLNLHFDKLIIICIQPVLNFFQINSFPKLLDFLWGAKPDPF